MRVVFIWGSGVAVLEEGRSFTGGTRAAYEARDDFVVAASRLGSAGESSASEGISVHRRGSALLQIVWGVPRRCGGRKGHLGCGSVLGVGALEQSFCYDFCVCGVLTRARLFAPSIRLLLCS